MQTIIRIVIAAVVALPVSGLYNSWQLTGAPGFQFSPALAITFTLLVVIGLLIANIPLRTALEKRSQPSSKPARPALSKGGKRTGEVKWFNGGKGFGFISCDSGDEIFVHFRSVQKGSPRLAPGKRVEFLVVEGKKGAEADQVVVV